MRFSDFLQLVQSFKHFSRNRAFGVTKFRFIPPEISSVQVTGIIPFFRIFMVSIVIFLTNLIPAVDNRDTGLRQHIHMQCQIVTDCSLCCLFVSLIGSFLDTTQRSGCTTLAGISGSRVCIIQFSSCKRIFIIACEEITQVFLVSHFIDTELSKPSIVQSPADIVMTTQIIQEYIVLW